MTDVVRRANFGWLPDIPDHRDLPYRATTVPPTLPPEIDLTNRATWPEVYDQGYIGSCVANVVAAAIEYEQIKRATVNGKFAGSTFLSSKLRFTPSRLWIYYLAREIIGLQTVDSGCYIRDAIKVVYNMGAPRESGWSYKDYLTRFILKPLKRVYNSAPYHKITEYRRIPVSVTEVRKAIAEDFPVMVGIGVFSNFPYNDPNGYVPLPEPTSYMDGGHAILLVGYNDVTQTFKFRNSWGPEWGDGGYGYIPYAYIGNPALADDFWVLTDSQYKERLTET